MPRTRQELEQLERDTLAAYAQFSGDTRGRKYKETPPDWRTHYQRDRDRVIHSRAFRRLEYKTQVFLNGTGDHLRTRLTHTMEVAAISRSIASALKLNTDLTETIALAHDLGHSPFGHMGETVLARLMKGHGGFEHNVHSLRLVEELEQKYPDFPGLNLTWEVREGLMKHYTAYDHPGKQGVGQASSPALRDYGASVPRHSSGRMPLEPADRMSAPRFKKSSLEAQIANLADEITYYSHDLDDGLDSGLLSEKLLARNVRIFDRAAKLIKKRHGQLPDESRRYAIIRVIIDLQIRDVVETSEKLIRNSGVKSADEVRLHPKALVQYSPERRALNLELRKYLYKNLYYNPLIHEPNKRAAQTLERLFRFYVEHPREIGGETARKRIGRVGLHRAVCDYVAGMTDRYALLEYKRLFGSVPDGPVTGKRQQPSEAGL